MKSEVQLRQTNKESNMDQGLLSSVSIINYELFSKVNINLYEDKNSESSHNKQHERSQLYVPENMQTVCHSNLFHNGTKEDGEKEEEEE